MMSLALNQNSKIKLTRVSRRKRTADGMSNMRSYGVLVSPLITEKSTALSSNNCIAFIVTVDANKFEIKNSVERIFNVKVLSVQTIVQKGKVKRFRGRLGVRPNVKKAYVQLSGDATLDFSAALQ